MSAYTRAYKGLVAGGMAPASVALVLAELRRETGTELAADLRTWAREAYPTKTDASHGDARKQRRAYSTVQRAADRVALTAWTPHP